MTLPWLAPESKLGAFFLRPSYDVAPALYIVDWLVFVPKGTLSARSVLWWLLYPVGYAAVSLLPGAVTEFYPYPFLEVGQLGYERVLLNMGVLMAAFAVLGLILVGIDRLLGFVEPRKAS